MRLMLAFVALACLAFVGCASSQPPPLIGAEAVSFVREAREVGCSPALDVILGPLQSRPCPCAVRSSGSAETPTPTAPAPTAPPAPSVPPVAPASTSPPSAGPTKGRGVNKTALRVNTEAPHVNTTPPRMNSGGKGGRR
jgi:hypothetical protein